MNAFLVRPSAAYKHFMSAPSQFICDALITLWCAVYQYLQLQNIEFTSHSGHRRLFSNHQTVFFYSRLCCFTTANAAPDAVDPAISDIASPLFHSLWEHFCKIEYCRNGQIPCCWGSADIVGVTSVFDCQSTIKPLLHTFQHIFLYQIKKFLKIRGHIIQCRCSDASVENSLFFHSLCFI